MLRQASYVASYERRNSTLSWLIDILIKAMGLIQKANFPDSLTSIRRLVGPGRPAENCTDFAVSPTS